MMNAPDVGRALEDLVHYLGLHDRGGVATFEVRDGTALLGFTVIEPETQAVDQICDLSMAVARNLMRGLCGPKWVPSQVLLPRKPPADPTPWTRVFNSPVQFNAGQCALAFPSRWLAHPVAVGEPAAAPAPQAAGGRDAQRQRLRERGAAAGERHDRPPREHRGTRRDSSSACTRRR